MNAAKMLLWLLLLLASPCRSKGQWCDTCDPCPPPCAPAICTIRVPQTVITHETRMVTRYRPETRERMVTVHRDVPSTETIQEEYTVLVPQTRTRTVADTINRPFYGDIQLRVTTMTPRVESRQGTYTVSRLTPVQEERCECAGCPPTAASGAPPATPPDPNAPPAPPGAASPPDASVAGGTCCAPRRVCVTCWKPVSQQVTAQYAVTRLEPNSRMKNVSFHEFQPETKFREESYVVQVPETRTRTRDVAVTRQVAEQQPERYTVMVPYQERVEVPVVTRRYVEQPMILR